MASRVESRRGRDNIPSARIKSLSQFQERLLVQAMTAFPDVERIVYSTSSLLEEENEQVLAKALDRVQSFQVVPPQLKEPWKGRGNPEYPFGSHCLVADMQKDQTNGLFVAVLERIPGMGHSSEAKSKKRKSVAVDETKDTDGWEAPKKKKKAKKNKQQMQVDEEAT